MKLLRAVIMTAPLTAARYKLFRNATMPVRLDDIDCDSGRFVGSKALEDLDDKSCRVICSQDCQIYHSKEEIANCLDAREALNCLFSWWEGYSIKAKGCDDSVMGYYPMQLQEDATFGLHAATADRGMAWVEVVLATNVEKPGNSDCITNSNGFITVWPESKLHRDSVTNKCLDVDGQETHYETGLTLQNQGLGCPIHRHDWSYTLGFNITDWMHRAGNLLEGGMLLVLQANQCWGSFKRQPGAGGVVVQKKHPLTDFTQFLD